VTGRQLALGDCDPAWEPLWGDDERLYVAGDPRWRDLRNQGLSPIRIARIVDVKIIGEWL
jgi:hypothetical protein